MKADLAPKNLYTYSLFSVGLALMSISIIHQSSMQILLYSNNYLPFILTTIIWVMAFLLMIFLFRKCRYIVVDQVDNNYFIIGNFFSKSEVSRGNISIDKKIFLILFKVSINSKPYYIFSFEKTIEDYEKRRI
jgi:hypothetical protein